MKTHNKKKLYIMAKNQNIHFLGFVDRVTYATIVASSRVYVETKRSGGTHPSLVESMGHGCLILANDHSSHKDVLGNTAKYYKKGNVSSLTQQLKYICSKRFDSERRKLSQLTRLRAKKLYSWDAIVDSYEKLFRDLLN